MITTQSPPCSIALLLEQLTLEQHGFDMRGPTFTDFFFNSQYCNSAWSVVGWICMQNARRKGIVDTEGWIWVTRECSTSLMVHQLLHRSRVNCILFLSTELYGSRTIFYYPHLLVSSLAVFSHWTHLRSSCLRNIKVGRREKLKPSMPAVSFSFSHLPQSKVTSRFIESGIYIILFYLQFSRDTSGFNIQSEKWEIFFPKVTFFVLRFWKNIISIKLLFLQNEEKYINFWIKRMNASNILPVMFVYSSPSSGTALRGAEAQLSSRHTETPKICSFFIMLMKISGMSEI